MFNVSFTLNIIIISITIPNEIDILNAFTHIFENISINLGIYTLDTIALFFLTILILFFIFLLKKSHAFIPIKIKAKKYSSFELNTTPKTKAYIIMKHSGSNTHQIQFKYVFLKIYLVINFKDYNELSLSF